MRSEAFLNGFFCLIWSAYKDNRTKYFLKQSRRPAEQSWIMAVVKADFRRRRHDTLRLEPVSGNETAA